MITLDKDNVRIHPDANKAAIKNSLSSLGAGRSILIDADDVLIAGNGVYEQAEALGIPVKVIETNGKELIAVKRTDLNADDERRVALAIADNRLTDLSEFDDEALNKMLDELSPDMAELAGYAVDPNDLMNEGNTDEDEVPEVTEATCKLGDLWILGNHRLLCGDSTDKEQVEKLMDGEVADFCFTSPPYSDMRDYGGGDMSVEKISSFIPASADVCGFYAVNLGLQRKDGSINPYWNEYINKANESELKLTSWNIWSKKDMGGSVANMTAMFPIEHEWIFIFGGDKESVNRTKKNKTAGMHTGITNRQKDGTTKKAKPTKVQEFGRMGTVFECCYATGCDHPAAFPVELPEKYIEACSQVEGVVYEPFCGSGTTLIAAEKIGRKCFGMELDPGYCDIIIERWQNYTGETAVKHAI